ncbi:MAG TPA: hypothetical protein VHM30_18590 [Gemmatimonadaceae bacterium]|nr:hypothetical protein [Gemmatimonadaceae bacterium]
MSPLDFLALLGMVSTPLALGFGIAWWTARRELELRQQLMRPMVERPLDRGGAGDAGRLENAVDAIALEVERIAEGQRFVTKLLAERTANERPALPSPERVITPH